MEPFLKDILANQPLIATFVAWFLAQTLKIIINIIRGHRFDFRWFISIGGFPSSHVAGLSALATSLGIKFGFNSGLFAISVAITALVIFDARVIRRAAGRQAEVLNKIIEDLYKKRELKLVRLKELLGHTSLEVFFGIVLGIIVGILVSY